MNVIFVFDSNLAGRHGEGAALEARKVYGATYGQGEGISGNSYALPTKDYNLKTLSLTEIKKHIEKFLNHAREHPENLYFLTPIGTGLAGYRLHQIWDIFSMYSVPNNVALASTWLETTVYRELSF